ncbi:E3 ubiquitin-protein ligase TRIM71-like [Amphiura filiformis]|uniref:E3 ubiquitin-protein ligase TRIM71-like n=1 Tax=Amphiura filiformis TaxID=82378 RepID=UPI003B228667
MAASLVRTDELDRQFLQCALCIDRLQKPKVLPCQHSFCQGCLKLWAARCDDLTLSCPVCRTEYTLNENGVEGLPDNFFVKSIIDFINRKRRVSSVATPCHGCDQEAAHYCHDCAELLCIDCAGAHRRLRLTRNHRLTTVDEYKTSGMVVRLETINKAVTSCGTHGKDVTLYCETCDMPICSQCTSTTHRRPSHVHRKLKDAAKVRRVLLNQLVDRAQRKVDELRECVSAMRETNRQLQIRRGHVEAQIKQRKETILELLDCYEQDTLAELEQEYQNRRSAMEAEIEDVQHVLDKTIGVCNVTENLMKEGDDASLLFINQETTRKLEEAISVDINCQIDENGHIGFTVPDANPGRVATFGNIQRHSASATRSSIKTESSPPQAVKIGEDIRVILGTRDAAGEEVSEGGANVSAKLWAPTGEVGLARVMDRNDGNYDILFRPNIEGRHKLVVSVFGRQISQSPFEINVEQTERHVIAFGNPDLEGNSQGSILRLREPWGVAVSRSKEIILIADTGNSTIRIFDLDGNYQRQLNFPNFMCKFEPVDLALTEDENNLVVTDHSNCQVMLCNLDGQLIRLFGMAQLCRPAGVAINSIGYVFVADHEANCIRVFDSEGMFINSIGRGGNGNGEFNGPIAVTVNSKDELLVSDRENHRIQILDPDGEYLAEVSSRHSGESELKYPTGIAVDDDDNIVVCNDWNNRVLMFRSDGSFIKRIDCDSDGLMYPNGVAVIEDGKVAVVDYGNDSVRIFKNV